METLTSKEEMRQAVSEARAEGKTIGFVPTMGALHEGHLTLVREAKRRADVVVVSVFVNPTQFGPGEDFGTYPRDLARDLELLSAEEADHVFTPSAEAMYAPGHDTQVVPGGLAEEWCGRSRPGHFTAVATVVVKLLNLVQPDLAFFGEKDFQQLAVIRRVVRDLDLSATVVGVSVVRDADGLALSSRNAHLSAEERRAALALPRALRRADELVAGGERDVAVLSSAMAGEVAREPLAELEYAAVVDPETLRPAHRVEREARAILAARVGGTRLIDNAALTV